MDNYNEQPNSEVTPNLPEKASGKKSNPNTKRLLGIVGGSFLAMTVAVGGGAMLSQFPTVVAQVPSSQTTNATTVATTPFPNAPNPNGSTTPIPNTTTVASGSTTPTRTANLTTVSATTTVPTNSAPIVVAINPTSGSNNPLPRSGANNATNVGVAVAAQPQGNNNAPAKGGLNTGINPPPNGNNNPPPSKGRNGQQGNPPPPKPH